MPVVFAIQSALAEKIEELTDAAYEFARTAVAREIEAREAEELVRR